MAEKIPIQDNDGFFLQVDKIFFDLLSCTELNIYGILILAQVYEFKRNKKPCIMSTQHFCDLFKTSPYTIEKELKLLYDLGLLKKTVKTNQKNTISRVRQLSIPQNFAKTCERLLKNTPDKQPQNLRVPPTKKTTSNPKNLGYLQPLNLRVPSDQKATPKFDDKQPQNSNESNPQIWGNNNIIEADKFNNKLLEDNYSSSPASSTDDLRNENGDKNAIIPDANSSVIHNTNPDTNYDINEESENMSRYPNQEYEEMIKWFNEELNICSKYNYEIKWGKAAVNFAWGERERPDNKKDAYTPEEVIEYFTKENRLDYLIDNNWEHAWLIKVKK